VLTPSLVPHHHHHHHLGLAGVGYLSLKELHTSGRDHASGTSVSLRGKENRRIGTCEISLAALGAVHRAYAPETIRVCVGALTIPEDLLRDASAAELWVEVDLGCVALTTAVRTRALAKSNAERQPLDFEFTHSISAPPGAAARDDDPSLPHSGLALPCRPTAHPMGPHPTPPRADYPLTSQRTPPPLALLTFVLSMFFFLSVRWACAGSAALAALQKALASKEDSDSDVYFVLKARGKGSEGRGGRGGGAAAGADREVAEGFVNLEALLRERRDYIDVPLTLTTKARGESASLRVSVLAYEALRRIKAPVGSSDAVRIDVGELVVTDALTTDGSVSEVWVEVDVLDLDGGTPLRTTSLRKQGRRLDFEFTQMLPVTSQGGGLESLRVALASADPQASDVYFTLKGKGVHTHRPVLTRVPHRVARDIKSVLHATSKRAARMLSRAIVASCR
jgi:hypothetical protein